MEQSRISSAVDSFNKRYVRPKAGRTLIVGSRVYDGREDRRALYADAVGVDMLEGPGVDRVLNLEETPPAGLGKFAHVECWSVLEHSRRPWKLATNLQRLMEPGATLHVTVPFVWRVHGYPNDYWRFTRNGVMELFDAIDWVKVCFAHIKLKGNNIVPEAGHKAGGGYPYMARTEVLAFGVRR